LSSVADIEGLSCVEPAAAFYAMVCVDDPERRTDERFVLDLLKETGVLVVHGSGFGADPASCHFRLVYLPDEAVLGGVFQRLAAFMRTPAAPRR
jgi:alanine-synthesizing transaminase